MTLEQRITALAQAIGADIKTLFARPVVTVDQALADGSNNAIANNAVFDALALKRPITYKVYTARLTQSGTAAPVETVLENTLGGTVVWARINAGNYTATLSNAFTSNKTFVEISNPVTIEEADVFFVITADVQSVNVVSVKSINNSGIFADNILGEFAPTFITIKVYL